VDNTRGDFIVVRDVRSRLGVVGFAFGVRPKRRRGCFKSFADDNVSLDRFNEGFLSSGLIIHHDDLPVPSLCIRLNRLCNDKL